jgi:pyruvate carboxylase
VIAKVLVANRGEIAIRAFRAAYELGLGTIAVYPEEDRNSAHRSKADESYQIGEAGHPVRAYLNVDEIVATARACGADAIYPGYGLLSEKPELATSCASAGITFVGPSVRVLELAGNKSRAVAAARAAGLPVWHPPPRRRPPTSWWRPLPQCSSHCSSRRWPAAEVGECAG